MNLIETVQNWYDPLPPARDAYNLESVQGELQGIPERFGVSIKLEPGSTSRYIVCPEREICCSTDPAIKDPTTTSKTKQAIRQELLSKQQYIEELANADATAMEELPLTNSSKEAAEKRQERFKELQDSVKTFITNHDRQDASRPVDRDFLKDVFVGHSIENVMHEASELHQESIRERESHEKKNFSTMQQKLKEAFPDDPGLVAQVLKEEYPNERISSKEKEVETFEKISQKIKNRPQEEKANFSRLQEALNNKFPASTDLVMEQLKSKYPTNAIPSKEYETVLQTMIKEIQNLEEEKVFFCQLEAQLKGEFPNSSQFVTQLLKNKYPNQRIPRFKGMYLYANTNNEIRNQIKNQEKANFLTFRAELEKDFISFVQSLNVSNDEIREILSQFFSSNEIGGDDNEAIASLKEKVKEEIIHLIKERERFKEIVGGVIWKKFEKYDRKRSLFLDFLKQTRYSLQRYQTRRLSLQEAEQLKTATEEYFKNPPKELQKLIDSYESLKSFMTS